MGDLTLVKDHHEGNRRFSLYALVCSTLLDHGESIVEDTLSDLDLDLQSEVAYAISREIPTALGQVLHGAMPTVDEGIARLADLLQARRHFVADHNPSGVRALERFISRLSERAEGSWSCLRDVERWHEAGRAIARAFYESSPCPQQKKVLKRAARCEVVYLNRSSQGYPYASQWGSGDERTIYLYFALDNDYDRYLRYPFLFLHEYISHVYLVNKGSERFEDGWLYYAAEQFFALHAAEYGVRGPQRILDDPKQNFTAPARLGYADAERLWSGILRDYQHLPVFHRLLHGLAAIPNAIPSTLVQLLRLMRNDRERVRELLLQTEGDVKTIQETMKSSP